VSPYQDRTAQLGGVISPITNRQIYGVSTIGVVGGITLYYLTKGRGLPQLAWADIGKALLFGLAGGVLTGAGSFGVQQYQEA
jgi:hypothetical protein